MVVKDTEINVFIFEFHWTKGKKILDNLTAFYDFSLYQPQSNSFE